MAMAFCSYAFVATPEQDCTLQEHALRTAGCEVSCRDGRTALARLLEGLRRGETRVVPQVDRLARHMIDL
jgi:DNA invertase Pin-like site-specific DNA recombinase